MVHLHWIGGRTVDFSQLRHIRRPLVYTLHDMFACTAGCHCTMDCSLFQDECRGNCPQLGAPRLFRNIPAWLFSRKRRAFGRIPSLTLVTPSLWLKREVERSCMFPGRKIVQIYNPWSMIIFARQVLPKVFNVASMKRGFEGRILRRLRGDCVPMVFRMERSGFGVSGL